MSKLNEIFGGIFIQDIPKSPTSQKEEIAPDPFGRTYYKCDKLNEYGKDLERPTDLVNNPADANLIGSMLENGNHAPTLDIDIPCELWPSTTEGHFHLIINKEMPWEDYETLLIVLAQVGVIEEEYLNNCLKRGQSMVRRPGVKKEQPKPVASVSSGPSWSY